MHDYSTTFPSICMPVICIFAEMPNPTLFLNWTASIALMSSADRKLIPSSKT